MATTSPDLPRTHELHDGTTIPAIGFGTYPLRGDDGIEAITSAITAGYRLVDTAVNYENEREVGEAIRRAGAEGIDRDELVVSVRSEQELQAVLGRLRATIVADLGTVDGWHDVAVRVPESTSLDPSIATQALTVAEEGRDRRI